MADDAEFTMTPLRLAVVMSNRVLRERLRVGKQLIALCDSNDVQGLRRYAEELLASKPQVPTSMVPDPTPSPEVVSAAAARAEADEGGLPPVRFQDDFEQGVGLALGQRQLATRLGRL